MKHRKVVKPKVVLLDKHTNMYICLECNLLLDGIITRDEHVRLHIMRRLLGKE